MAERGRTLRVTGLPTELKEDKLEDKLCIHFQRGSNGGGEVVSVTTVKTSPDFALVTFEDSRVAQRVIQQNQHILEVDGKSYNLIVNEHSEDLDQDKVVINLSATIDCSQLSGARKTIKILNKNHPDVQIQYSSSREQCTLSGSYSKVQAVLAQLFSQQPPTAENKDLKTSNDNKPNHQTPLPHTQVSHDHSRSLKDKALVEKHTSSLHRDITPGGYDWENTGQAKGATASSPLPEDFSLLVDADLFQYLQKYCSEEYHQILRQHSVAVVDFTQQGLTTLLLQVASGDGARDQDCLRKAREQISRLYEESRANVCQEKLPKSIFPNRDGLKRAMEKMSGRFTKLLFKEDKQNIYMIGNSNDVTEAKKFILFYDDSEVDKTDVTSPRRFQDSQPGDEVKSSTPSPNSHSVLNNNGINQVEDESKLEGSGKIRLAAQFKDSRLPPLGSKTTDFTLRGQSHSNKQTRPGPMLGYDVLSDSKGSSYMKVGPQNPGEDILFKSGDASTSLPDTRPKTHTVASSTQSDSLGTPSPATSGSSLRRSSSFSGGSKKRDQEISPKSDMDTTISRGRSSSFSGGSKEEHYSVEVTVSSIMWMHITNTYKPLMEELTSGLQFREKISEGKEYSTILITGMNSSKVASCQQGLQRLIDSVKVDFTIESVNLSTLGVTDSNDEVLQSCCTEIRSRYKKISMEIYDKMLYIFGPKILCSQVSKAICEVFSGAQISQDFSRPLTSSGSDSYRSSPLHEANGETVKTRAIDGTKRRELRGTVLANDSASPKSVKRNAVIKEKVSEEMDAGNTHDSVKSGSINGSVTTRVDKNRMRREQTGGDRAMAATGGSACDVCERAGVQVKQTQCGVTICSDCRDKRHSQCRVCGQREDLKTLGIKGDMSITKLPMSIPGYIKDPIIKISYLIPDGIQGEAHPSPGKPFKGGLFEAYLPDCEQTRKLLPRLQEAFRRGHTFTVIRDSISWDSIPHKTSLHGGKSGNGYPDSTYLNRLSQTLSSLGIH